ncbi:Lrp/AsnC family transcriptional regulator [Candidatus Woesearchaeota archaeon]|nr:Lrp/AsnC family transcriptional regulator [Nanoarchaeota archaeon]MCB9371003.1 Lrp/AsnC family transcriptional regulator [Candidatus Woesearchaeota archaeon]USN44115.1 MAG: Lrp/AsnC family transcriptional regulator [Candidatus Woesearchaeota archaeon]
MTKHDEEDLLILNSLRENAKISLRDLAKKTGISFVTVMKRIKKLEKEEIIKQYTTLMNYEQLGYDIHVLIQMRVSNGKLFEVENTIAKTPNVYAVYDVTGDFDVVVLARFKTTRQLDIFVKKMQQMDFVERTSTRFILNTIKEESMQA